MLATLGRGISPAASVPFAKRFDLTSALSPEITFERASSGTYTDSTGMLRQASTDIPRFNHNAEGNKLGLMIESAATNKTAAENANPADLTGLTVTTPGTGTAAIVDDSAALAAAGLDGVCTSGKVLHLDNSADGSNSLTLTVDGTVGNTNNHSWSFYYRSVGANRVARLKPNAASIDVDHSETYTRFTHENDTPDGTTRKFVLLVDPGEEVYLILWQMEEGAFCTSPILTHGATATRQADRAYIEGITACPWFDETQGYLACRYDLPRIPDADTYMAVLHDGSTANTMGLRLDASDHDVRAYVRAASVNVFTLSNDDTHTAPGLHAAGITWSAADITVLSGGKAVQIVPGALPSGLNRLEIGARNGGASPLYGHIQSIEIGKTPLSTKALGAKLQKNSDIVLIAGGQSLARGHFISQETGGEAGKQEHRSVLGASLPEKSVILVDASTGGSAAAKTTDPVTYWWDVANNLRGPSLDTFYQAAEDAGIRPTAILWAQGEADSHQIGLVTSRTDYKQALEAVFADMRAAFGDIPVYIQKIGRRTSGYINTGGIQAVREVQTELVSENSWCHEAAEIYDLDLYDGVHLDDAGYVTAARRNAQAVLGVIGPVIAGAVRTETTISVTLSHDAGTDFSPASGIEGFRFFDNTSEITITSAARTDAQTITLTLGSTPSGTETLYYAYDDMAGLNTANAITDNAAVPMPLRPSKLIL